MWCLQYSRKLNGGNQALGALFERLNNYQDLDKVICLSSNFIQTIFFILFKQRHHKVIVSDPLCAIILWLSRRSNVIHFIQSDDLLLFKNMGFAFNIAYSFFYKRMIFNSRWLRIFNSSYSQKFFVDRFGGVYDESLIVPMLGLEALFPYFLNMPAKNPLDSKFIWVGSKHSFKGGKTYISAVQASCSSGHMIFNGSIPEWAVGIPEITVEANLKKELIYRRISQSRALVYTSTYDSFALPIFEALKVGCPVIAIKNDCLDINNTYPYIQAVETYSDLVKLMSNFLASDNSNFLSPNWSLEVERFNSWLEFIKLKIEK